MSKMTAQQLKQLQSLPLDIKVRKTEQRIREWYEHWDGDVYVSFSGEKDSTVLLHIVRKIYPDVPAIFSDTGLEYPEIKEFVKTFDNVRIVRPKYSFREILRRYGYPVISKEVAGTISSVRKFIYNKLVHDNIRVDDEIDRLTEYAENIVPFETKVPLKDSPLSLRVASILGIVDKDNNLTWSIPPNCYNSFHKRKWKWLLDADFKISDNCCYHMKEAPLHTYTLYSGRVPYIGTLAEESQLRRTAWIKNGCNAYDKKPVSAPLSFWTEQDILQYIVDNNLKIASVYGDIIKEDGKYKTTGRSRTGCIFCMFGINFDENKDKFISLRQTHPKLYDYCMNGGKYNEQGWWQPSQDGLGMKHVLDFIDIKVK